MLLLKKELLSFEEFQKQVLEAFNASKEECEFWDSSYYFSALINYTNGHYLFFRVKYVTDPKNCNYGRWIIVKEYDKVCKDISDSLMQAIEVVAQKTSQSIKEELAVFKHIKNN
jgi:hypothetical protein